MVWRVAGRAGGYAENTDKRVCPCHPIAAFLLHVGAYSRAEGQIRRGEQYAPTLFVSTLKFLYIKLGLRRLSVVA